MNNPVYNYNPKTGEYKEVYLGNLSTCYWEFKNKEDDKKYVWWNPLDWIPKYFTAERQ